jgi:hypothetical protein
MRKPRAADILAKLGPAKVGNTTSIYMTLLAYTGAAPLNLTPIGTKNFVGLTYSQLLSTGWTLIGNYADVAIDTARMINNGATPV